MLLGRFVDPVDEMRSIVRRVRPCEGSPCGDCSEFDGRKECFFLFGRGMNDGGGMCKREQVVSYKQGM